MATTISRKFIDTLRDHVVRVLDWRDAHADFEGIVSGIPPEYRDRRPEGLPYSLWQLLEHMRFTQWDILEFCRNPSYKEPRWPQDYWPPADQAPTAEAWEQSLTAFRDDREALRQLALNPELDLFATIPHGAGQTYLREILLVADHNAYHLGQMVTVRRLLGIWKSA